MRVREYGKFNAEFTDFTGRTIQGTSIIIDGHSSKSDNGGWNITTGIGGDNAWRLATNVYGAAAKSYHTITLARLRAELGHTPVIIRARFWIHLYSYDTSYPVNGDTFGLFRCLPGRITQGQATYRYRANGVTYEGDGYSPLHGTDVALQPFSQALIPRRSVFGYLDSFDVREELLYKLRANEDLFFLMRWLPLGSKREGSVGATAYWNTEGKRPFLRIEYFNNLEFFQADPITGTIDLAKLLDNTSGESADWLYLGALQRGETSTPVKFFIKNLGDRTFPLVTVWKAHPDWTIPVQTAGTGTGKLDYVQLAENAVWQKYTVTFTSSSAYSVKAEAYRANPQSLNPGGGGTGWTGTTGSDWTAPQGGLTIPAAAWQPGTLVNDVFEFYVMGTATDSAWPADADEQVQITRDAGGAPDGSGWRSITAAYTRSTAPVTINATTKKFPTRAIITSMWPVGTPAFVGNSAYLHNGTVASVDAAARGNAVFTGSGLDDLTASGNYNGTYDDTIIVEIDDTGTPDTFKWSKDNGATWVATGVAITGSAQLLADGIHVTFAATTGHTLGDRWSIAVTSWGVTLSGLTNDGTSYPAGAVVSTGLPVRDLGPSTWTRTRAACGASSSPPNRIPVVSVTGFASGDVLAIQSVDDPDQIEVRTVATGGVGADYLDVTAVLGNDYETGSIVIKHGSGERGLWARVVATAVTAEEIKTFRLSART